MDSWKKLLEKASHEVEESTKRTWELGVLRLLKALVYVGIAAVIKYTPTDTKEGEDEQA